MAHIFNFDNLHPNDIPFAVVFDVETTRTDSRRRKTDQEKTSREGSRLPPHCLTFLDCTVSQNTGQLGVGSHIIQQQKKIPKKVIEIHGITDQIAKDRGQPLAAVLGQFSSDIRDCDYFVGFNVMFDKYVVEADCIRCDLKSPFVKKEIRRHVHGSELHGAKVVQTEGYCSRSKGHNAILPLPFHNSDFDTVVTAALFCALHQTNQKY